MNSYAISGIVVRTRPETLGDVVERLAHLPGIEVHHIEAASGRVVMTLETERPDLGEAEMEHVRHQPGILSVELAYQYVAPPIDVNESRLHQGAL